MKNGCILWEGPSQFDPSVTIGAIMVYHSDNRKTGNIPQVYIMRKDVNPCVTLRDGRDQAVCGNCPLRAKPYGCGACYVAIHRGPFAVWKNWNAGLYESRDVLPDRRPELPRTVRVGAYGDPLAVPFRVWNALAKLFPVLLGYTHSWKDYPAHAKRWMASCHTQEDIELANSRGLSTFTALSQGGEVPIGSFSCLYSKRDTINCANCRLCFGDSTRTRNVFIDVHGPANKVTAYKRMAKEKGWL